MGKKEKNKDQALFGFKCVILALVLFLIAGVVLYIHFNGGVTLPVFLASIVISALVIVVLILEIIPYIRLHNAGVREIYKERNLEVDKVVKFNRLIEHNEFIYNFQPIINAKDGSVYAYEILMRSQSDIGLNPHEILKYAEISKMLYTIERCTFFNVLEIYKQHREEFGDKKIFINSIPNVTLTKEDLNEIKEKYSGIAENIVIEILENADDDDDSIAAFEELRSILNCEIAIDDYGSGYSNDGKLLNNNPNYIKIDISLIHSIDTDLRKQLLVANLIKFGKLYNIMILAEGVETQSELSMLLELGVDLIQGFYTARPSGAILQNVRDDVKFFIMEQNIRLSKFDNSRMAYDANDCETVDIYEIALNKYTTINVSDGIVKLVGRKDHIIDMVVRVDDGAKTKLILEDVNIKGDTETTIQIGHNSSVELVLVGDNILNKEGIRVPETSSLTITGAGNLTVKNNRNRGVGIGSNISEAYGSITVDMAGKLIFDASGDKVVCVGGGAQGKNSIIRINSGKLDIRAKGILVIGIGSASGLTSIDIGKEASVKVVSTGNESVCIGALSGEVKLTSSGNLEITNDGERICGIGVINGGKGRISLNDGRVTSVLHGAASVSIGSLSGDIDISSDAELVSIYSEGETSCGIGNYFGKGSLEINSGTVAVEILSGDPVWLGSKNSKAIVMGGNIVLGDKADINAVNSFGEQLIAVEIADDTFEKHIVSGKGDYVYRAEKNENLDKFCVLIPECAELHDILVKE